MVEIIQLLAGITIDASGWHQRLPIYSLKYHRTGGSEFPADDAAAWSAMEVEDG
jgi:hypothetical protein